MEVDGEPVCVGVTIREDNNGQLYYNHAAPLNAPEGGSSSGGRTETAFKAGGVPPGWKITLRQDSLPPDDDLNITLLGDGGEKAPRAAVELTDSMARIMFGPDADASSIVHESGHVFLHLLRRLGTEAGDGGEINAAAARDWSTVRDWPAAARCPA